jgi:hypothetical protein
MTKESSVGRVVLEVFLDILAECRLAFHRGRLVTSLIRRRDLWYGFLRYTGWYF